MAQKRFLTASEVFQLFGIDASGLEKLIKAGDIEALQDQNTFRYRSEDFAKLVKAGKIKPRASAEMFQIDDDDDVPFMDLKEEDKVIKFDEDMLFLELDEKALAEQAAKPDTPYRTPVVPDKWFDDTDVSIDKPKSKSGKGGNANAATDVDMKQKKPVDLTASDSDVRIFTDDDAINLDSDDAPRSGSDSDVRLVGPVTSPGSSQVRMQQTKKGSDSDVSLVKTSVGTPQSDSDVMLVGSPTDKSSALPPKRPAAKLGDSDSDVRLSSPSARDDVHEEEPVDLLAGVVFDGESAIRFERSDEFDVASVPDAKLGESKSDIPISQSEIEVVSDSSVPEMDVVPVAHKPEENKVPEEISEDAIEILLDEEEEPVAEPEIVPSDEEVDVVAVKIDDVEVAAVDDDAIAIAALEDDAVEVAAVEDEEIEVAEIEEDDNVSLESDIVLEDKLDAAVVPTGSDYGSGIVLEQETSDSGIQLEQTGSGVRFVSKKDSDIHLADSDVGPAGEEIEIASVASDSAIKLTDAGSGIHLERADEDDDSGITLESSDSGISLLGPDSGITLEPDDSGIRLGDDDSGISLESDSGISLTGTDSGIKLDLDDDSNATFAEIDKNRTRRTDFDADTTDKFELDDVSSDVNIEHTLELDAEDSEERAATTAAYRGPSKRGSTKQPALSEAFQLDEQPEVEDLDISEDLDAAGVDFTSGDSAEFIPAHDDVLEVSDDAFSAAEIPIDDEEPAEKSKKKAVPAAKKKTGPREPSWGIVPVGAIACAAIVMLATVTVLWGGLATMWTGGELPGPAGAIVSMLGNLF